MAEEADRDQCSEDSVLISVLCKQLSFPKPQKSDCRSEERPSTGRGVPVALSCGHEMTSDYVIAWFKYYLKQGKTAFTCPEFHKGQTCGAKLSYKHICKLIPLTDKQREFLEENLALLAARRLCDFKSCPGCQSHVERQNQRNPCVHCTLCTANMKRTYYFCWNCQKEWKGPVNNAVQCGNSGCGQVTPDPLVKCEPEFKQEKLRKEGDDIYPTKDKSNRKRLALLINNVEFEYIDDRIGADKDEQSMERLLKALGYTVITLTNLTAQGMTAAVKHFARREEHVQSDSCFVVFMSHGNANGICGVSTEDGKGDMFSTDDIFECLNTPKCAGLRDKPKIILIQACRGGKEGCVVVKDSVPENSGKEHIEKDFCCLRSCTPDTVSVKKGSDFFQDIVEIFNQHAHQDHIEELFRKVLKKFKEKHRQQMPCKERTTLSKMFYLFPGL